MSEEETTDMGIDKKAIIIFVLFLAAILHNGLISSIIILMVLAMIYADDGKLGDKTPMIVFALSVTAIRNNNWLISIVIFVALMIAFGYNPMSKDPSLNGAEHDNNE